jgi:hypothetical protein
MTPDERMSDQEDFDSLSSEVDRNRADIDALQAALAQATGRADAIDARAAGQSSRMDTLEARFDLDREVIAQLQADGLLSAEHAAHLEHALRSSRRIGAAIGIVMAYRHVSEEQAFKALCRASQEANRKLSIITDEVVRTGDVSSIPAA